MKPFRTSLTARIVSLAVAFALAGGGAIPIFGFAPAAAVPIVLLLSVAACIVGCLLGAQEHAGATALLAMMLPLALWPYTLLLLLVVARFPQHGWTLMAAGAFVAGLTAIASFTTERASRAGRTVESAARAA